MEYNPLYDANRGFNVMPSSFHDVSDVEFQDNWGRGRYWYLRLICPLCVTKMPHCLELRDVGLWLEEINLGGYHQIFRENNVNGEYLEGMSMFKTEQILRFIRHCHMKCRDFIILCKELRRIKVACFRGEQKVRRPRWAPSCLSVVFVRVAKRNRQSQVVSLKLEP